MCYSVSGSILLRGTFFLMYLKFKLFLKGKKIICKACRGSKFVYVNKEDDSTSALNCVCGRQSPAEHHMCQANFFINVGDGSQ